jgi:hypothetical protein
VIEENVEYIRQLNKHKWSSTHAHSASGSSWSYSYGSWIYNYLCNLPIPTKVVISSPVHREVYSIQHYVIKFVWPGWWFSLVSSNKIGILLKVALNTINKTKTKPHSASKHLLRGAHQRSTWVRLSSRWIFSVLEINSFCQYWPVSVSIINWHG